MRVRVRAALLLAFLAPACARKPAGPALLGRLADRAAASPDVEADTRALAAFGARVTGSRACEKGEELAAERLHAAGLAPSFQTYDRPAGAKAEAPPRNVLADLPGREGRRGVVLLAAHLDGVSVGEGASDDAVNVAVVLEAARTIKALAPAPRRTIRFALFTGEEQALAGSTAYVGRRGAEPHALVVVFDLGSAPAKGFYMNGRKEPLRALFLRALAPDPRFRALFGTYDVWTGSDGFPFVRLGIPVLTAFQPDPAYAALRHTANDAVQNVNFESARRNAGLAAALAFGAADDPEPDLPRLSAEEAAAVLARHGISASSPGSGPP
jgi:hypothetical protein